MSIFSGYFREFFVNSSRTGDYYLFVFCNKSYLLQIQTFATIN